MLDKWDSRTPGSLPLEGRVVDDRGQPVVGARISLDCDVYVDSNEDGRFTFTRLVPSLYRLAARKDEFCADIALVTLHEGRSPVVLSMSRGITLRAQVMDGNSPVAGARILLYKEVVAVTGEDGLAVVCGVGDQFQIFDIVADGFAPTFLSMWLAPDPGGTIARSVQLSRGARVSGIVLDPEGKAVAEASVRVRGPSWGGDTLTDPTGAWNLEMLAAGTYELRASSKDHAAVPNVILELDGRNPQSGVVVRVARGGTIKGNVVDAQGDAVASSAIVAIHVESEHRRVERSARGDENGRFELKGLEPGTYDLFAHDTLRATALKRIAVVDGDVSEHVLVVANGVLAGTVVDVRGDPIVGCEVRIHAPVVRGDLTDQQGRFHLGALPPGEYDVFARRPEQRDRSHGTQMRIIAGDTVATLVLAASGTIKGRVLCDGEPLPFVGILVTDCPRFHWIGRPTGMRTEEGHFSLTGVTPGTCGLVLAAAGTAMHTIAAIVVEEGGTVDLGDVVVPRGQRITGRVRDEGGEPVAGARVVIGRRSLGDEDTGDPLQDWFQCEFQTITDNDGAYLFDGITSARPPNARGTPLSAMHVERGSSVCVPVPEGDAVVDLTLVATGTIDGLIEGFPGGFGSVNAERRGEPVDLRSTRVGPTGTFVIDRLPPGDYTLAMTSLPRAPVASPIKVSVAANERTSVRLVMPVVAPRS